MKKILSITALSLVLALANGAVFACDDCNCKESQNCKCEKVCDKNCDCGCQEGKKCDCKKECNCDKCDCQKMCDCKNCDCKDCKCKDCKCESKKCKKKVGKKFNFFKSKKIKCNCVK